ncbi:MAG: hypothetical protein UX10_C0018G0016 [Candidatus Magasanikbacteria bacterium GW2011_GWA2_45_39]|uniref:Uncharacterized protein n=1 Tax=Candidatus Magasanikbacteria bacterium GW2011_GWA2_45_39 TaxID=1619041 RepID=A0A0G1QE66_9BACT|nr:MAG: hypothetical protein UX10_C0018G0016 [Candidatus Magasanikbacteria bacterium GW2011_GWA2_45_39]HBW74339.1 hypothetical protein [Candidatus Magasanikbacteria bacterium]
MELNFRAKIIIWVVGGILIITLIAGGLWWFLRVRKSGMSGATSGQKEETKVVVKLLPTPSLEEAKDKMPRVSVKEMKQQTSVAVVVREFVERFGSFSPDSDMVNFDEVKPLATASFIAWMEGYKKQALAGLPTDVKGITTRFVSLKTLAGDDAHQSLEAATQREENTGSAKRVYYQRMLVKLVLEDSAWKVDGAYWQAKE